MKDFKQVPLIDLIDKLNEIEIEKQKLDLEYNQIIYELWERIPPLKEENQIQPKVLKIGEKK